MFTEINEHVECRMKKKQIKNRKKTELLEM